MHRNGTNERPVATRETATRKYGPQHSQCSSPAQPRLSPYLVRKMHWSAVRRRFPFMQPPSVTWLKCSRMHVRYFDDNVVFFGTGATPVPFGTGAAIGSEGSCVQCNGCPKGIRFKGETK
jgi:hypothetical protein